MPIAFQVIFTQAAREELVAAQDWYEGEAPGLGRQFRGEIDSAVGRISENPSQFPFVFKTLRRALVRRFPYMLFFTVEGGTALVVACFHASRDPQRWQQRSRSE